MERDTQPNTPEEQSRLSRLRSYVGVALLVIAVAAFSILIVREITLAPPPVEIALPQPAPSPTNVTVHVGGAVSSPGVYTLPAGSRVVNAIETAGGLTSNANTDGASMAQELEEGASYIMPSFETPDESAPLMVFVHLVGAVERPGTYTLAGGARLIDALDMAGGAASEADMDAVNLAVELQDGQRYYIPYRGEQAVGTVTIHVAGAVVTPGLYTLPTGSRLIDAIAAAGGVLSTTDIHAVNLAQPIEDGARYIVPQLRATVNINVAGASELESVPGISRTMAQAIVNYRDAAGAFTDLDQLLDIPGIGPSTLAAIRPFVSVT